MICVIEFAASYRWYEINKWHQNKTSKPLLFSRMHISKLTIIELTLGCLIRSFFYFLLGILCIFSNYK